MQRPAVPSDEASRLNLLYALGALDEPPDDRFDAVVRVAQKLFDVPIVLVSLVDDKRQWFRANVGLDACQTGRDVSFCGHAILQTEPFVVEDARQDPRFADNPLVTGPPHVIFYAGVPLQLDTGSAIGTLCLIDHEPRDITAELPLLVDLANMVVSHFNVDRKAVTDPLTGLLNRRGFELAAGPLLAQCRRNDKTATVFYVDLDHFKQINDTFGHAAGDEALREITRLMRASFRRSDLMVRVGGDEFAMLCPGVVYDEAVQMEHRLQEAIIVANAARGGSTYTLACSCGFVVRDRESDESAASLLARADQEMYRVKQRRRGTDSPKRSGPRKNLTYA